MYWALCLMTSVWQPYREPVRTTLLRTFTIALVLGAILVASSHAGWSRWPVAALICLWPSLGGHFVELFFLNRLRPRISPTRVVQVIARLAVWFAGGVVIAACMRATAVAIGDASIRIKPWPAWLLAGGVGFLVVELIAHAALQSRGRPSFYNRRG